MSGLLPTGMATLLLADVEGSTRLWETQPEEMTSAIARLNQTVSEVIAAYGGVRPVEQGEGDSFVAAFARASDALACALELQRALDAGCGLAEPKDPQVADGCALPTVAHHRQGQVVLRIGKAAGACEPEMAIGTG